jgi:hypothetical protein
MATDQNESPDWLADAKALTPPAPPSVEEVLGDVTEPDGPTDEELAAARLILARAKKAKPKDRCPGDGCGKKLEPGWKACPVCLAKKITCVRCGDGPFICPLCVADGHKHCALCMRPPISGSNMCELCDTESRKANLIGNGPPVTDNIAHATDQDIAKMLTPTT